jgi:hypothetical protein
MILRKRGSPFDELRVTLGFERRVPLNERAHPFFAIAIRRLAMTAPNRRYCYQRRENAASV